MEFRLAFCSVPTTALLRHVLHSFFLWHIVCLFDGFDRKYSTLCGLYL